MKTWPPWGEAWEWAGVRACLSLNTQEPNVGPKVHAVVHTRLLLSSQEDLERGGKRLGISERAMLASTARRPALVSCPVGARAQGSALNASPTKMRGISVRANEKPLQLPTGSRHATASLLLAPNMRRVMLCDVRLFLFPGTTWLSSQIKQQFPNHGQHLLIAPSNQCTPNATPGWHGEHAAYPTCSSEVSKPGAHVCQCPIQVSPAAPAQQPTS